MCVCVFVCVLRGEGGVGGGGMVGNYCPEECRGYNFICGESVCGYGNGSTGK